LPITRTVRNAGQPCRPVARLCITLPSDRRVQKNLTTTLHELDTVYSVQDMWWLIEIMTVDNANRAIAESDHGSNGN
ncbi:hypothetical protein ACTFY5_28095, partial [Klebsiella pneumoniae]